MPKDSSLEALLALIQTKMDAGVTRGEIVALVESGQPRRFEMRGDLIRAAYGHSRVEVEYPRVVPPAILYHGTHHGALASIRNHGLRAMKRQYVHLSTTMERAREVASRRTRGPVILSVRALDAHVAGVVFHSPEPQHFLARRLAHLALDSEILPEQICFHAQQAAEKALKAMSPPQPSRALRSAARISILRSQRKLLPSVFPSFGIILRSGSGVARQGSPFFKEMK